MHGQGWPKFVFAAVHLQHGGGSADDDVIVISGYSPTVTTLPDKGGTTVTISGSYPFSDSATVSLSSSAAAAPSMRKLRLRVPCWSEGATIATVATGSDGHAAEAGRTVTLSALPCAFANVSLASGKSLTIAFVRTPPAPPESLPAPTTRILPTVRSHLLLATNNTCVHFGTILGFECVEFLSLHRTTESASTSGSPLPSTGRGLLRVAASRSTVAHSHTPSAQTQLLWMASRYFKRIYSLPAHVILCYLMLSYVIVSACLSGRPIWQSSQCNYSTPVYMALAAEPQHSVARRAGSSSRIRRVCLVETPADSVPLSPCSVSMPMRAAPSVCKSPLSAFHFARGTTDPAIECTGGGAAEGGWSNISKREVTITPNASWNYGLYVDSLAFEGGAAPLDPIPFAVDVPPPVQIRAKVGRPRPDPMEPEALL
eukprot:SAG11_NODE_162_length_13962_cov_19.035562_8_plen_428_part_00